MNVTSYKISKKLAEIGFKSNFDWAYKKDDEEAGLWSWSFEITPWKDEKEEDYYPAYDLETILEGLPEKIDNNSHWFSLSKKLASYICNATDLVHDDFRVLKQEHESLADIAARLLILLESKGLVNFNKDNNKE